MAKTRWVDFREVKARVSFEAVLERYGVLPAFTRRGDSLRGPCPIHQGSHPKQFVVSVPKQVFYCFGRCRAGGNVLDFVAKKEGVALRDAALLLAEWFELTERPKRRRRPAPA